MHPEGNGRGDHRAYLQTSVGVNTLLGNVPAVAAQTAYTYSWTITQPAGTGYKILVRYKNLRLLPSPYPSVETSRAHSRLARYQPARRLTPSSIITSGSQPSSE